MASVLNSADRHHAYIPGSDGIMTYTRGCQPSILRDMAYGAAAGFAGALIWRRMKRRKAAKGELTSPGFRCLALLALPIVVALVLPMIAILTSGG